MPLLWSGSGLNNDAEQAKQAKQAKKPSAPLQGLKVFLKHRKQQYSKQIIGLDYCGQLQLLRHLHVNIPIQAAVADMQVFILEIP